MLDGVLIIAAVAALLAGWRLGLICGLVSVLAILAGGALGFTVGRLLGESVTADRPQQTLVVMGCTVIGIVLAQVVTTRPAQRASGVVEASPLRWLNRLGGAALTLAFGVAMVWLLATALALSPSVQLASLMRGSAVLVGLDRTVPSDAGLLLRQLEASSGLSSSTRVFTGLGLLPAPVVELPDQDNVSEAGVRTAAASVVRVTGHAVCGTTLTGSGIVVGENLVLTNAHVVAGVPSPVVFGGDRRLGTHAIPVYFDTQSDLALLRVSDLRMPAVTIDEQAATGDLVAIAGYPNGGPLQLKAARIRGPVTATGTDLYGVSQAQREILVIAGDVIPGDSGGAVLNEQGHVVGVVFAAAMDAAGHTAYALSGSEAAAVAATAGSSGTVSTGPCLP